VNNIHNTKAPQLLPASRVSLSEGSSCSHSSPVPPVTISVNDPGAVKPDARPLLLVLTAVGVISFWDVLTAVRTKTTRHAPESPPLCPTTPVIL